jgi:hypothetical protein
MTINESYKNEFDRLNAEGMMLDKNIHEISKTISEMPPLTDLKICKQLENEYYHLYEYYSLLAETSLKVSQLYRYTHIMNQSWEEEGK